MKNSDLYLLKEKFQPAQIEWRLGKVNKDKLKGIALPYVTNRAIQDRLDSVCGMEGWGNVYESIDGGQKCGIWISVDGEKITKYDGAENTNVSSIKGGFSGSMKRAAAQWGIGRYLYDLPTFWVDVKPYGNSYKMVKAPILPAWALPKGYGDKQNFREGAFVDDNAETLADVIQNKPDEVLSKNEADVLLEALKIDEKRGLINIERCLKYFGVDSVYKLTGRQKGIILQTVNKREKDLEENSTAAAGKRKGGK